MIYPLGGIVKFDLCTTKNHRVVSVIFCSEYCSQQVCYVGIDNLCGFSVLDGSLFTSSKYCYFDASWASHELAARPGFEPRYSPPEGEVLPLDDLAIFTNKSYNTRKYAFFQPIRLLPQIKRVKKRKSARGRVTGSDTLHGAFFWLVPSRGTGLCAALGSTDRAFLVPTILLHNTKTDLQIPYQILSDTITENDFYSNSKARRPYSVIFSL